MSDTTIPVEVLFEKAQEYSKTTFELCKLHAIDKSADVVSSLVSRLAILMVVALFTFILNIALSLWIGELLGKTYYGFLVISGAYALLALVLYINRRSWIKYPVSNSIIAQMLKQKAAL